jgi:hypothetical protein
VGGLALVAADGAHVLSTHPKWFRSEADRQLVKASPSLLAACKIALTTPDLPFEVRRVLYDVVAEAGG